MVKLTKIYTRGGDKGETSLGDGSRVKKHALRVAAYGTLDEANAAVGMARLHTKSLHTKTMADSDAMLMRIQNDLFDLGADLCTPIEDGEDPAKVLRIIETQVDRLEREIDAMNARLKPLESFVLPGGCPAAAYIHLARTIVRRGEREIALLMEQEPVNPQALIYANRLSDHLFVMSRHLNAAAEGDVLWTPGSNRK
ncbi:MAG: cob(I)yrinic acid a,c-diamide adenosyltransferase [Rhodospirillaceae bacterium]|nr:cob(I)yrinic acid a,c-diamide adenosyltransferase [Rhodospirillaceae bacterium]